MSAFLRSKIFSPVKGSAVRSRNRFPQMELKIGYRFGSKFPHIEINIH